MKLSELVILEATVRDHTGKPLRGVKKELALRAKGDKWKFDQDQKDRDDKEEFHFGTAKVSKAKRSATLDEEAIEVEDAAVVWSEHSTDAKTFVTNTAYFVKKIDGGEKYEVSTEEGTVRKAFATLTRSDLDASFTPARAKQTPDAEGYIQYRDNKDVEAFKFDGDPVKVNIDGTTSMLNKGDYLTRTAKGSAFAYEVKKAKNFDSAYIAK